MSTTRSHSDMQKPADLYMALELGEKTWKMGFSRGVAEKPRLREVPARDIEAVKREIAAAKERFKLPRDARVASCYEAGRDGFWVHRFLLSIHAENLVVDSSSIQVNRRKRRAKTDRLDAQQLVKMLARWCQGEEGVWSVVEVPSVQDEDARQLHRELETLRHEQTAHVNRIRGLLSSVGVTVAIDRRLPKRLAEVRLWDGSPLPAEMHQRLLREFERMQVVNRQIRQLEAERVKRIRKGETNGNVAKVRKLLRLKGLGMNSTWLYVHEVFGWRHVHNRRELASLVGLVPTPYRSGEEDYEQGISKAGNRRMRALAVEIAWVWLRYQPQNELSRWYMRRFGHGNRRVRRIGIVGLARKLLVALWKYLETNLVPEGAELVEWQKKQVCFTPKL